METKKKRKNGYVRKLIPKRERWACKLDIRVIELINEHYAGKGKIIAEKIEELVQNDLGIKLPPPPPREL